MLKAIHTSLKVLSYLLVITFGVGLAALVIIETPAGHHWIERLVNEELKENFSPYQVHVEGLSLSLLNRNVALRHLTIKKNDQLVLESKDTTLDFAFLPLLKKTFEIKAFSVESLYLSPDATSQEDPTFTLASLQDSYELLTAPVIIRQARCKTLQIELADKPPLPPLSFDFAADLTDPHHLSLWLSLTEISDHAQPLCKIELLSDSTRRYFHATLSLQDKKGLLSTLFHQDPEPLQAYLAGEGSLDRWEGDFALTYGKLATAHQHFLLTSSLTELNVAATGSVDVALLAEHPVLSKTLGHFSTTCELVATEKKMMFKNLQISHDDALLKASLTFDEKAIKGDADLEISRIPAVKDIPFSLTALLKAHMVVDTHDPKKTVTFSFQAPAFQYEGKTWQALDLNGSLFQQAPHLVTYRLTGSAESTPLGKLALTTTGSIQTDTLHLHSDKTEGHVGPHAFVVSGDLDMQNESVVADLTASYHSPRLGTLPAHLKGTYRLPSHHLTLKALAHLENIKGLEKLNGVDKPLSLESDVRLEGTTYQFAKFHLDHPSLYFQGKGLVDPTTLHFHCDATGKLSLDLFNQTHLRGATDFKFNLSGPFLALKGKLILDGTNLNIAPFHLDKAHLELTGKNDFNVIQAIFTGQKNELGLKGSADLQLSPDTLHLSAFHLRGPDSHLQSNKLRINLKPFFIEGTFNTNIEDLKPWSSFLQLPLQGKLTTQATFHSTDPDRQDIDVQLTGKNLLLHALSVEDLHATLALKNAFNAPGLNGEIHISNGIFKETYFDTLSTIFTSDHPGDIHFTTTLAGQGEHPFTGTAEGNCGFNEGHLTYLRLDHLVGDFQEHSIALSSPLHLHREKANHLRIDPFLLHVGTGTLEGKGRIGSSHDVSLELRDIPAEVILGHLSDDRVEGNLSSHLHLTGSLENPSLMLEGRGDQLHAQYQETEPLSFKIEGKLAHNVAAFSFDIITKAPIPFHGKATIPFLFSLSPFQFAVGAGPKRVTAEGLLDVAPLSDLFTSEEHHARGLLETNATFQWRSFNEMPTIIGTFTFHKGSYENIPLGLVLSPLSLSCALQEKNIQIDLHAQDNGKGTLSLKGNANLKEKNPIFDAQLDCKDFRIIHNEEVDTTVSGALHLSTDRPKHGLLRGNLTLSPFHYTLKPGLPEEYTPLAPNEIHEAGQADAPSLLEIPPIGLDIALNFPRHLYLDGRGLDSQWSGTLALKGTLTNPVLLGKAHLKRGHFNFAGKNLSLMKHSKVVFSEIPENDPDLLIKATYQTPELLATFSLTGRSSNPNLAITADPVAPEEEIISQVLFGKSAGQISFAQSLQLASALQSLKDPAGGFTGIMDSVRTIFGVDTIAIKEVQNTHDATQTDTALSIGKYVSERVYISIDQDLTGGKESRANVEITVTPQTTIETNVGEGVGAGFNWRWSY